MMALSSSWLGASRWNGRASSTAIPRYSPGLVAQLFLIAVEIDAASGSPKTIQRFRANLEFRRPQDSTKKGKHSDNFL
jgi:hypothetical protein